MWVKRVYNRELTQRRPMFVELVGEGGAGVRVCIAENQQVARLFVKEESNV
jgi:hypothetical protein